MPNLPTPLENRLVDKTEKTVNDIKVKIELRRIVKNHPTLLPFTKDIRTHYQVKYRINKEGDLLGSNIGYEQFSEEEISNHQKTAQKIAQKIKEEIQAQTKTEQQIREDQKGFADKILSQL